MRAFAAAVACALASGFAAAAGAELAVGDALPELTLEDQHGESHTLGADTKLVLMPGDMDAGDVLKEALADADAAALAARGAVYLADISGMPRMVARLFALPSMRRRAYPMLLDRDGTATAAFPRRAGEVTLIFVEGGRIARIDYATAIGPIRGALAPE